MSITEKGPSPTASKPPSILQEATASDADVPAPRKPSALPENAHTWSFWLVIGCLLITTFLSALDLTAISTALPTIAKDLNMDDFAWVGSAYALTSTAFMPWFASMSTIFGRRNMLLLAIVLFAVGSALCGAAKSQALMIAGRSISGIGGGGILSLSELLMSDLVPLANRGLFAGLFGLTWSIASAMGPPVGGALAGANWRWLFYLNLPLAGISLVLVRLFLTFKIPTLPFNEKIRKIDFLGNGIFVVAITLIAFALTVGGAQYNWQSAAVLVPLVCGVLGLPLFAWVENKFISEPILPIDLLKDWTVVIGYILTALHGIIVMIVIYFFPIFFQGVKGYSPIHSGVSLFSLSFTIAPLAIVAGVAISIWARYKAWNVVGCAVMTLGIGLMCLIKTDSSMAVWVITPIVLGLGTGIMYTSTTYVVQASLPVELATHILAFHAFSRSFGQILGVCIGATILQNSLKSKIPSDFLAQIGYPSDIAFAALPYIKGLAEPNRTLVRDAYTDSLRWIWVAGAVICGVMLLLCLPIKEAPLHQVTDERYAFEARNDRSPTEVPPETRQV